MRKSNLIVFAIMLVIAFVLLAIWYLLGFNRIDDPLDLMVTIAWVFLIALCCAAIQYIENVRQKNIRTAFLAPGVIYNSEAGIVKFDESIDAVEELANILENLDYDFKHASVPNDSRIRFKYIVHTSKFKDKGDTWVGEVVDVAYPEDPRRFNSERELAAIIK